MSQHHVPVEIKTSGQDFLISVTGYVTSLLTALILWLIQLKTHFAFYMFSLAFVIPLGAMVSGLVASSGYYLGALLFNHRPTRILLLNILIASVATFFIIYYFQFVTLTVNGKHVSDTMSFPRYLNAAIRSTTLQVDAESAEGVDTTSPLGNWGYLYAALQVVGFAIGGFLIYQHLGEKPYCAKCSRYMASMSRMVRFTPDTQDAKGVMYKIVTELQSGGIDAAMEDAKSLGHPKRDKIDTLCAATTIKHCKKCERRWLSFMVRAKSGRNWKLVKGASGSAYADPVVEARA